MRDGVFAENGRGPASRTEGKRIMNEELVVVAAAVVLIYGILSGVASRSVVMPPMAFMLVGLLCGPLGFDVISLELDSKGVALLATVALVIIVCSDASEVDRREIRKIKALPIRLLLVGLPLTMLLGAGIAGRTTARPGHPTPGTAPR